VGETPATAAAIAAAIVVVREGEPVACSVLHALLLEPQQRLLLGRQALIVLCGMSVIMST
jgi:hypothetical protein